MSGVSLAVGRILERKLDEQDKEIEKLKAMIADIQTILLEIRDNQ
jgi:uncharacterized coiled-coil protein SlyX|tara:strand:- start:197 stop:331 length:135 start_codon:yes stop_codon:yes gene_type:complete